MLPRRNPRPPPTSTSVFVPEKSNLSVTARTSIAEREVMAPLKICSKALSRSKYSKSVAPCAFSNADPPVLAECISSAHANVVGRSPVRIAYALRLPAPLLSVSACSQTCVGLFDKNARGREGTKQAIK
jgi:hypothetical protein